MKSTIILIGLSFVFVAQAKFRVLIGSPVRQKPPILKEFLISLQELQITNGSLEYYFIDDNTSDESTLMLTEFREKNLSTRLINKRQPSSEKYLCTEVSHAWTHSLIEKVGTFKDEMIHYAQRESFDYLFLVDSDLILHPKTIQQLINANKEIISNIFWTRWMPNSPELPQVWIKNEYDLFHSTFEEQKTLSSFEKNRRTQEFIEQLRKPGTYEVGGLGACTLISRSALTKGVSFKPIKNLSFIFGEDRYFCIRAVALDIDLFVDTHFPAYHIYRETDLAGIIEYKKKNQEPHSLPLHDYIQMARNANLQIAYISLNSIEGNNISFLTELKKNDALVVPNQGTKIFFENAGIKIPIFIASIPEHLTKEEKVQKTYAAVLTPENIALGNDNVITNACLTTNSFIFFEKLTRARGS